MAIDCSYRFDYVAAFEPAGFKEDAIVVRARSLEDGAGTRLVGPHPKLRFCNDRLVLIAGDPSDAAVRWASFPVGDAVSLLARPGDVLHVLRTASLDLALWIVRDDDLVVALGALSGVRLGRHVRVTNEVEHSPGGQVLVGVRVEPRQVWLAARESANAAGYDVYVERASAAGPAGDVGVGECVSVVRAAGDPRPRNAAIRSAVLLAQQRPDMLQAERWDGHVIRWSNRAVKPSLTRHSLVGRRSVG